MRIGTAARLAIAMVAVLAIGCSSPAPEPDSGAADGSPAAPATATDAWYRRARALDLTGDGRADSVRLEARGARADSLAIALTLVVEGVPEHREEWGSSYELALVDSAVRAGPQAGALLRARLDSVLASVVVRRLDAPGARLVLEDSAALAGLASRPTHLIAFSYGYESTTRLVWDAPRERLVRLWSCC